MLLLWHTLAESTIKLKSRIPRQNSRIPRARILKFLSKILEFLGKILEFLGILELRFILASNF